MFFTQDDYKKIQQWLIKNSVKDTEFNEANIPFNGEEIITVVQGNQNKRIFLKDLVNQLFSIGICDFVNVTDKYNAPNISLEEAIRLLPSIVRREGQVITFLNKENNWQIYQFKGDLTQWNILDLWEDLFDWENLIIDSILPDEEDLTKSPADANGNSYLSLKDRAYNPEDFSGLGRVILRKNIVEIEDPIYGKVKKNVLYQDMFTQSNTIYELRYDFDLNGQNITLPDNSYIEYNGGSISNGNIIDAANNLNKITLRKNIKDNKNILTQNMINKENTIYEIRYDFDLNDKEIIIPEGCVLDFQGGSLKNGKIIGNNTTLKSEPILIFNNCELSGIWHTIESRPEWFGSKNTSNINKCFKYFSSCVILTGNYVYDETIIIPVYSYIESIGLCTIDANDIDGVVMEINHYGNSIKLDSTTILVDKNRTSDVIVIKGGSGSGDTDNRAKKCRLELPFVASNAGHWKEDEAPCSAFVFDLPNGNYIIETEFLLRAKAVKNAVYIKKEKGSAFMSNVNFIIYSWWNNYCLRFESGTITAGGLYFYLFSQPSNRSLKIIHIDDGSTRDSYNRMNWRFDVVPWDMQFFQDYAAGTTEVIDWCVGWDMKNVLTTETRLSTYFTNKHLWNNESEACKRDDLVHSTNTISSLWYMYYKIFTGIASDADRNTALVTAINNIIKIGYDYSFDLLLPPLSTKYMSSTYSNRFKLLFGDNSNYNGYAKIKIIKENIGQGYFKSIIFEAEGTIKYTEQFDITIQNGVCTNVTSVRKQVEQIIPNSTHINSISTYSNEINKGRSIFIENVGIPAWFNGTDWVTSDGYKSFNIKGTTVNRPVLDATQFGFHYYDTNLQKTILWTGSKWVDNNGRIPFKNYGGSGYRPSDLKAEDSGVQYYDTTLNKPIWWTGSKWVDATGADV